HPSSPPFPYTTLFRSRRIPVVMCPRSSGQMRPDETDYFCPMLDRIESGERRQIIELRLVDLMAVVIGQMPKNIGRLVLQFLFDRSEEHTSELQSPCNL